MPAKMLRPDIPHALQAVQDIGGLIQTDELLSGLLLEGVDGSDVRGKGVEIIESRFTKCTLSQAAIEKFQLRDCILDGCDLTAGSFPNASWHVIEILNSRCSGLQLQMGMLKNVLFKNCKLDLANLRFARLENVAFIDCVITDIDFYNAQLKNVAFTRSALEGVTFSGSTLKNVDLSGSPIVSINGIQSLKGASISQEQLMQLAPYFAREIGITVKE